MKRTGQKEAKTNIVYEYSIDECSIFDVLFQIGNSPDIRVRTVTLNDLSSRSDEGNGSRTMGAIVSPHKLKEMCAENGIDVVTILARYDGTAERVWNVSLVKHGYC